MKTFTELYQNPPKIKKIKKSAQIVVVKTVSAMCDNVGYLTFKKNKNGEFFLLCSNHRNILKSFKSWKIKNTEDDLTITADNGDWVRVVELVNSGTTIVESIEVIK